MNVRAGIDLGGSFIKAGLIKPDGTVVYRYTMPTEANAGADKVKRNLLGAWYHLRAYCDRNRMSLISLGVGSPGTIAQPFGIVSDASPNIKGWQGTRLVRLFEDAKLPIFADNDANCAALAEYLIGTNRKFPSLIFITIGTGIGGGLIIDGKLLRGSTFAAGEIGHMVLRLGGRPCKCGKRGCLEAYASVPNMILEAKADYRKFFGKTPVKLTSISLYGAFERGNKAAKATILRNVDYLGTALASVVNLLNPHAVIIGGGFSGAGSEYIRMIADVIKVKAFKAATSNLEVMKARLGNDAGFMGAALLAHVKADGKIIGWEKGK